MYTNSNGKVFHYVTKRGRLINVDSPDQSEIVIDDIVECLENIKRGNGTLWSVARHSHFMYVIANVYGWCNPILAGIHDLGEFALGDVITKCKSDEHKIREDKWLTYFAMEAGITSVWSSQVEADRLHRLDVAALLFEMAVCRHAGFKYVFESADDVTKDMFRTLKDDMLAQKDHMRDLELYHSGMFRDMLNRLLDNRSAK